MLLVADVVDNTDMPAVAPEDEVTRGGGKAAARFGPLFRVAVAPLHRPLEHFLPIAIGSVRETVSTHLLPHLLKTR